jgi:hypothetical protein
MNKFLPQEIEAHHYYSLTEKTVMIHTVVNSPSQYTFGELKIKANCHLSNVLPNSDRQSLCM